MSADLVRRTSRCGGRPTTVKSLATYVPPRVLTNQDLQKLADAAVSLLLDRINDQPLANLHITLPISVAKHRIS